MNDFVPVIELSALVEGEVVPASVDGLPLAFYLIEGQAYCTTDACTHEGSLLSEGGYVERDEVECPYHGARFNLKTGAVVSPPAVAPLRCYAVELRDGIVCVAFD